MGRLFWKIFIPFWLSAAAIMVMSILWVDSQVKKEIYPLLREQQLRPKAFLIANLYESGIKKSDALANLSGEARDSIKLLITDENQIKIYGDVPEPTDKYTRLQFPIVSLSNRPYQVEAYVPDTSPMSLRTARQLLISYSALVMIAFAFISFVLTLYFIRPIKLLHQYTRQIAQGNLNIDTSDPMLNRKDELGELARSFDDMSINISEQINAKQQLVHDLTHEIHAPLARLDMAAELSLNAPQDEQEELIERVHHEVSRIKTLTHDIVRMSDINGMQTLDDEEFDVNDTIADIIVDALFVHPNRNIEFQARSQQNLRGGRNTLTTALENIIRNALKHTEGDIEIQTYENKHHLYIDVRDHGQGVEEANLQKLTLPFYKGSHSKGTGIGLAITSKAVNSLGGKLRIKNVSQGLLVSIQLPLHDQVKTTTPES